MASDSLFQLQDVHFAYEDAPAIRNVNLTLEAGRFYGIIGPNGSGKTTLLDLLCGEKKPASGKILFKGRPLRQYDNSTLSREMALVPQEFQINFAFSVLEVVMMGRHPYIPRFGSPSGRDWQITGNAMTAIGIDDFRDRLVTDLSGGEKQRVIVARALAQQTPILLLDEATSNLDIRYTLQILNVAKDLVSSQDRTIIAVLHNLNLAAAFCDEIVLMKNGKIHNAGATATALTPAAIQEVFGVESRVETNVFSGVPQVNYRYFTENSS
mgnify:CR=1 FL=1